MLKALFGNRTAVFILLFLERKGEACATRISRGFGIPVNMVQKQLGRFEKGQILKNRICGRRKIYFFNTENPICRPLKKLLGMANLIEESDPADGTRFDIEGRLQMAGHLVKQAELLNPFKRYDPFVRSFGSFGQYEKWRKTQKNPWLV